MKRVAQVLSIKDVFCRNFKLDYLFFWLVKTLGVKTSVVVIVVLIVIVVVNLSLFKSLSLITE